MQEKKIPLLAKTISGLEEVLAAELANLGATDILKLNRAVSFTGDKWLMYKSNYLCRTALRILMPLFHFEIKEQKDLYDHLHDFAWEDYLDERQTLSIDAVISYTVFTNSQFVAQKSKDAIVDRIRERRGKRPSVDLENPDFRINVHLFKDLCTVSLDSSGQSLHRRGYRKITGAAPISETLAAGLIQLSKWDITTPLMDPMCGSGTLLIEAAMLAKNIPAGYFRKEFGFMKWKDFDSVLWEKIKKENNALISTVKLRLFGSDQDVHAIDIARENVCFAALQEDINLEEHSFETLIPPFDNAFLISNPPYDERMKLDDAVAFYKMIGNILKQKYAGFTAWIISSDLESLKFVGLRPSRRIPVFNGPLECRFVKFDLFAGRKGQVRIIE
ncbi:MAG: THUMP domain-containing protein [Bacteroidales bacterium]|nr:THUMP domain-containing protein [Bacteroidales bacterium]